MTQLKNPYHGLLIPSKVELLSYVGNQQQLSALLRNVQQSRFITLVGKASTGKSTLVKAGLIPKLEQTDSDVKWSVTTFTPGTNPINNLAEALVQPNVLYDNDLIDADKLEEVKQKLRLSKRGLKKLIEEEELNDKQLLIVVDQFEELFDAEQKELAKNGNREETTLFVDLLLATNFLNTNNVHILLILRSDFIYDTIYYSGLHGQIIKKQDLLPPVTKEDLKQLVTAPLLSNDIEGIKIADNLLVQIVDEAHNEPYPIPVLSHFCQRLYAAYLKEYYPQSTSKTTSTAIQQPPVPSEALETIPKVISKKIYDEVLFPKTNTNESSNIVSYAINNHGEEVYNSLKDRQQDICRKVFQAIATKDIYGRERGRKVSFETLLQRLHPDVIIEGDDVRRVEYVGPIQKEKNREDLSFILNKFRDPSVGFITPGKDLVLNEYTLINLSQPCIIHKWDTLSGWTKKEREYANTFKELVIAGQDYKIKKEIDEFKVKAESVQLLWRDHELAVVDELVEEECFNQTWAERYESEIRNELALHDYKRTGVDSKFSKTIKFSTYYEDAVQFYMDSKAAEKERKRLKRAAKEERERRERLLKRLAILVTALWIGLIVVGIGSWITISKQKREILNKEREAKILEKAAKDEQANAKNARDSYNNQIKATEKAREDADAERAKAEAAEAKAKAEEAKARAKEAELIAKEARLKAEQEKTKAANEAAKQAELEAQRQADSAKVKAEIAREAEAKAQKSRRASLAKAIALRAINMEEGDVKAKLALAAYDLNKLSGEFATPNESYIHQALYGGLYGIKNYRKKNDDTYKNDIYHSSSVNDIYIDKTGKSFYTVGSDGKILAWSVQRWKTIGRGTISTPKTLLSDQGTLNSIAVSGDYVGIAGRSKFLFFNKSGQAFSPNLHNGSEGIAIHPLNNTGDFVSIGKDGSVQVTDFVKRKAEQIYPVIKRRLRKNKTSGEVTALATDPKKQWIAWGENEKIKLYDYTSNTYISFDANLKTGTFISKMQFSKSGKYLAVGYQNSSSDDGRLNIYELQKGKWTLSNKNEDLVEHNARIMDIKWLDDSHLVTAGADGVTNVWVMENFKSSGYIPLKFIRRNAWAMSIAFSPNKKQVIVGYKDGAVRFWNIGTSNYASSIFRELKACLSEKEWDLYVGDLDFGFQEQRCERK